MTPLYIFSALAIVLVGLVVLVLLRTRASLEQVEATKLNAAVYRDQNAELDRELQQGQLTPEAHAQARAELERRIVDEGGQREEAHGHAESGRIWRWVLGLGFPAAAVAMYIGLGSPQALNPQPVQKKFTQQDVQSMVEQLAQRMARDPGDLQGWRMLARSYQVTGEKDKALQAYASGMQHGGDQDADFMLFYADALASSRQAFDVEVMALINQALALRPDHAMGLWLRGTAHYSDKNYKAAIGDWEQLLNLVEPGSKDYAAVQANLDEARSLAGLPPASREIASLNPSQAQIEGEVEVGSAFKNQVPANSMLMIVVKAVDGPPMPIAVLRVPAANMPTPFSLSDAHALMPSRLLSQFDQWKVQARISATGQAFMQAGDLYGDEVIVKRGEKVSLLVNQVKE